MGCTVVRVTAYSNGVWQYCSWSEWGMVTVWNTRGRVADEK